MSTRPSASLGPEPSCRVDRRAADALRAAEQKLRDARLEAEELLARAREDAERVREAARAEALEAARVEQTEWTARALADMTAWFGQAEAHLAERVGACVEALLERELTARPDGVVELVRATTRDLRDALDLRICVHPDDVPRVQTRLPALRAGQRPAATLRVCADPELTRGCCRVESELGVIDASRDGQLDALRRAKAARPGATS